MKRILKLIYAGLFLSAAASSAQFVSRPESAPADFKNVEIGFYKTTSIVFPYPIKSVDKGSEEILVQKAKGVENVLLVKAAVQHFRQTNLTVVTGEGKLYGFTINYDELCPVLNLLADKNYSSSAEVFFDAAHENGKEIEKAAGRALHKKKKIGGLSKNRYEIRLQVKGIFIKEDIMYFRLVLRNTSQIGYHVDQLRFFIRDLQKAARTASQEIELLPIYSTSLASDIPEQSEVAFVMALPKFTIPEKKYLVLQLLEKEGGRHLELRIRNSRLSDVTSLDRI